METAHWYVVTIEKLIDDKWVRTFKTRRKDDWRLWIWPDGTFWDIYRPDEEEKTVGKITDYTLRKTGTGAYLTCYGVRWGLIAAKKPTTNR